LNFLKEYQGPRTSNNCPETYIYVEALYIKLLLPVILKHKDAWVITWNHECNDAFFPVFKHHPSLLTGRALHLFPTFRPQILVVDQVVAHFCGTPGTSTMESYMENLDSVGDYLIKLADPESRFSGHTKVNTGQ
jgi:hypothetical protein